MTEMPPPPEPPEQPAGTPDPYDLAYGTPYDDTIETAPPAKSKRGVVVGATAAVLAVLAGAGVYAATVLSGGGMQPDELVPKTTFAYAKVDLDPAAGQKLAARSFFSKFPKFKDKLGSGEDNPFEKALEELVSDDEDVKYATDIEPWFDRRAAFAAFPSGSSTLTVSVLRSKDDAKARTALDKFKQKGDFAYTITKGYVVISDSQAHLDDALKQSAEASLEDNDVYTKDVDTLTGDQVATGWVDIQQTFRAALSATPEGGLLPTAITDRFKGRAVAGLHFASDYVEVEGKTYGVDARLLPQQGGDSTLIEALPESTVATVSVTGFDKTIESSLNITGFDATSIIDGYLDGTGLTFRDDLLPLLGSQTVLAMGNVFGGFEDLRAGLVTAIADPAKATASGAKVAAALQQFGFPAKAQVKGNTFYLASPGAYSDELAKGSGGLGSSGKFTKAVGKLDKPAIVAYVDIQAIVSAMQVGDPDAAALRAFGMVFGGEGGNGYFRSRLTVG